MIVCCGEALIDMLPRALPDGEQVFLPVPGGAIFNTAIALGRLGEDAGFLSSLSSDLFGEQLVTALQASNVDTQFTVRLDHPTTLAFVKLENGHAQYSFFDENSAGRNLTVESLPQFSDKIKALHFGAISLIPEPCGGAYEEMMARFRDKLISIDPNIRPAFIDDNKKHRSRLERMIAMSDIVKVSDEDLEWIAPSQAYQKVVSNWLAGATAAVLITRGDKGVSVFTRHATFDVPAHATEVIDTIGAGDTFNAGFLAGLRRLNLLDKQSLASASEADLKPAIVLATRVAAATCAKAGALPPWQDELED